MFLRMFGIGVSNAIAGEQTEGTVIDVKPCWWLKVNTKPVRRNLFDGAVFPHIIHFTYCANGQTYTGKRYVNWNKHCPIKGEKITVYYETNNANSCKFYNAGQTISTRTDGKSTGRYGFAKNTGRRSERNDA